MGFITLQQLSPCAHGLQRGSELLGLDKPQTQLSQTDLVVALDPGDFRLRRHPGLQFCNQLHPPHQLRHPLTLVT
jgi:hypothetical protein